MRFKSTNILTWKRFSHNVDLFQIDLTYQFPVNEININTKFMVQILEGIWNQRVQIFVVEIAWDENDEKEKELLKRLYFHERISLWDDFE